MKTKLPKQPSNLEAELAARMRFVGFPDFETEYQFDAARRWRFDFAFPQSHFRIAVEAEGGVWSGGRHVRGAGFIADTEKYNRAAVLGWCVLRFSAESIKDNSALDVIEEALRKRGWKG